MSLSFHFPLGLWREAWVTKNVVSYHVLQEKVWLFFFPENFRVSEKDSWTYEKQQFRRRRDWTCPLGTEDCVVWVLYPGVTVLHLQPRESRWCPVVLSFGKVADIRALCSGGGLVKLRCQFCLENAVKILCISKIRFPKSTNCFSFNCKIYYFIKKVETGTCNDDYLLYLKEKLHCFQVYIKRSWFSLCVWNR